MKLRFKFHWHVDSVVILILILFYLTGYVYSARLNNVTDKGHQPYKISKNNETEVKNNGTIPKGINVVNNNGTKWEYNATVTQMISQPELFPGRSEQNLPIALIISSPAVAVGVFIFICITYRWHSKQLDAQSKELAAKAEAGSSSSPCIPSSPCRSTAQRLLVPIPGHAVSDSDLIGQRRKSLRTPTPPPLGLSSKRGSCLSAVSDQEVLARASPRRHSTFIL